MADEREYLLLPSELDGFEGTLLDPNWAEVRGVFKGLWFWEDWSVYYADQLKWQEIMAQIKANMDPRVRKALFGNEEGETIADLRPSPSLVRN